MANRKVFQRTKDNSLAFQLTKTDLAAVESVARFRLILATQLRQLHWPRESQRRHAEERLRELYHAGWLERIPFQDGASRPCAVYLLGKLGRACVRAQMGTNAETLGPSPAKERIHDQFFLKHHLATVQVLINLTLALQACNGTLLEFKDERQLRAEARELGASVIPDAFVRVGIGSASQSFAIEMDRATVSLRAWRSRINSYLATPDDHPNKAPVLIVVSAPEALANRRVRVIESLIETEARQAWADASVFWLASLHDATPSGFLKQRIWAVAGQQDRHVLMPGQ